MITICRNEHFNAAHRLFNPKWSDEQNLAYYGKCAYPHFHGHNYELNVYLTGEIEEETGYLIDIKEVSSIIQTHVCEYFDHKNLNMDCVEFKDMPASTENLAIVIWNKLRAQFAPNLMLKVEIFETPRNSVIYEGKKSGDL